MFLRRLSCPVEVHVPFKEKEEKKEVKPRTAKPATPVPLRFLHQKKL
jgi:hypothetical protein